MGVLLALTSVMPNLEVAPLLGVPLPFWLKIKHCALVAVVACVTLALVDWQGAFAQQQAARCLIGCLTGCVYMHRLGFGRRTHAPAATPENEPMLQIPVFSQAADPGMAVAEAALPRFTERERRMTPRQYISEQIDPILDKISLHGIGCLTPAERRVLEKGAIRSRNGTLSGTAAARPGRRTNEGGCLLRTCPAACRLQTGSSMKWYYAKDGQPCGPVEEEEFARLAAAGEVTATTLVWRSGLGDWKPFAEVRPPEPDPAPAPPLAVEPDPPEPEPEHSDLAVPPVDAEEVRLPYAGFWIRVAAMFFDCLILLPVVTVLYFSFIVAFPDFLTRSSAWGARQHFVRTGRAGTRRRLPDVLRRTVCRHARQDGLQSARDFRGWQPDLLWPRLTPLFVRRAQQPVFLRRLRPGGAEPAEMCAARFPLRHPRDPRGVKPSKNEVGMGLRPGPLLSGKRAKQMARAV